MILTMLPILFIMLSVVGIVLLTLGLRGQPTFGSPHCAKCSYDLRNVQFMSQEIGNCPECGVSLAAPGAVSFGRWRPRPRQIVLGVVLLFLPWLGLIPLSYMSSRAVMVGPAGPGSKCTPALLTGLPATVTQPWDWQELERRLSAGTLGNAETNKAFAVLAAHLVAQRAVGKPREPLHWAGNFVGAAIRTNKVSPAQLSALCQAYYGVEPKLIMRQRAREGDPIPIVLNDHESWNLEGTLRCWALTGIAADGSIKLMPQDRYNNKSPLTPDALSGAGRDGDQHVGLPNSLPPGEHELTFTFEMGVISDQATLRGIDGKPGTPEKWPAPIARWPAVVKRKLTVLPRDQSPVNLITDPAKDPFKSSSILIEQMVARPSSRGVELVIKWKFNGAIAPTVAYRVWVQTLDQKIDYGTIVVGDTGRGTTQSYNQSATTKTLPANIERVDILLIPDTKVAEQHTGLEEIWGLPLEINDIPLERSDLTTSRETPQ